MVDRQHRPPGGIEAERREAGTPAKTEPAHTPTRAEHDDDSRRRYIYPMPVSEWALFPETPEQKGMPVPRVFLCRYDIAKRYSCGLTKAQACINALPHVLYNGRKCVKLADLLRYEDKGYRPDWEGYRTRKASKRKHAATPRKKRSA